VLCEVVLLQAVPEVVRMPVGGMFRRTRRYHQQCHRMKEPHETGDRLVGYAELVAYTDVWKSDWRRQTSADPRSRLDSRGVSGRMVMSLKRRCTGTVLLRVSNRACMTLDPFHSQTSKG
jgi:hypothetical protein